MANFKYFAGALELRNVHTDNKGVAWGYAEGTDPVFVAGQGWVGKVAAERKIEYKANPSRHECDDRCINATGRVMRCECSCGGKNHGRGAFSAKGSFICEGV